MRRTTLDSTDKDEQRHAGPAAPRREPRRPAPANDGVSERRPAATAREAELEAEIARLRRALAQAERAGAREVQAERRAAAALAEGEERLRLAQEAAEVGVFETDLRTGHAHCSPSMFRLYGLDPEGRDPRTGGAEFRALVHPEDREWHRALREAQREDPEVTRYAYEFRIRRADTGGVRWIASRGEIVRDAAGRALLVRGANHDITERRRAEAALAESEARLRLAQEAAGVGVFERDLRTGRAHWSPTMFRLYGLDPEGRDPEVGDGEYLALLDPEDRERHRARRDAQRADPEAARYDHEFRIRRADTGEVRWIASRGEIVRDAEGRPVLVRGANHDITERRRAEAALAGSEARFRTLAEALPGFVWTAGPDGALDWVSPRWYAYTGAEPGAATGWTWGKWMHPDDLGRVAERWRAAIAAGAPEHEDEFRLRAADGEYRWFLVRVAPVRGADGRVERWVGTCTDVDPRHRAEERQSLLVNELNHRVKNSLAVALALADQTRRACAAAEHPPERFHADFQTRLVALAAAHDLLTREHWEGAPLTGLVRTALAPHAGRTDGSAARVSVAGPPVRLAPETALALSMAMHELATNAAKHGALSVPTGRVEVNWRVEPPGRAADDAPPAAAAGGTLVLDWAERGGPRVPGPPARRGFGSRLIERGLPGQLGRGGSVAMDFAPEGLRCRIQAPLKPGVVAQASPHRAGPSPGPAWSAPRA